MIAGMAKYDQKSLGKALHCIIHISSQNNAMDRMNLATLEWAYSVHCDSNPDQNQLEHDTGKKIETTTKKLE